MSREKKPLDQGERGAAGAASPASLYDTLSAAMVRFQYRPGERLNEGAIARDLGVSRTPVREALSKLVAAGLIDHEPGHGFFRRKLDPKEIFDLYELRQQIEVSAVRLAVHRATPQQLDDVDAILDRSMAAAHEASVEIVVGFDEQFHDAITRLTGNVEMLRSLQQINARIRFVRWIDMRGRRGGTQGEHRAILDAMKARDAARGCDLMEAHVQRRLEQIVEAVREGYASIYMGNVA
ncbi:GntR family transcriptional regulator [Lichenihabitans psoromatis]|uniref:GntR family transcriptional regulator n=1 Tax=Lichenihabitans psoromatis TaxID=2528642 RepID=UPI001036B67D|nr:GntR family transcriptional regulator [Lichenihabitans psoromatis]